MVDKKEGTSTTSRSNVTQAMHRLSVNCIWIPSADCVRKTAACPCQQWIMTWNDHPWWHIVRTPHKEHEKMREALLLARHTWCLARRTKWQARQWMFWWRKSTKVIRLPWLSSWNASWNNLVSKKTRMRMQLLPSLPRGRHDNSQNAQARPSPPFAISKCAMGLRSLALEFWWTHEWDSWLWNPSCVPWLQETAAPLRWSTQWISYLHHRQIHHPSYTCMGKCMVSAHLSKLCCVFSYLHDQLHALIH